MSGIFIIDAAAVENKRTSWPQKCWMRLIFYLFYSSAVHLLYSFLMMCRILLINHSSIIFFCFFFFCVLGNRIKIFHDIYKIFSPFWYTRDPLKCNKVFCLLSSLIFMRTKGLPKKSFLCVSLLWYKMWMNCVEIFHEKHFFSLSRNHFVFGVALTEGADT